MNDSDTKDLNVFVPIYHRAGHYASLLALEIAGANEPPSVFGDDHGQARSELMSGVQRLMVDDLFELAKRTVQEIEPA